jgi:trimeric autotransporter adhesin
MRIFSMGWQYMIFSLGLGSLGYANPSNPTVIQGTLTVENSETKTCVLTVGDATFIYWDDFSIAEDELTEFRQPSSQSTVVVEVTGNGSSSLLGTLKANGKLFLVNPNGVLIGENGCVDTYGFLISALPACPCPLVDGEYDVFIQGSSKAPIINKGRIKALDSDVYLIGYQIENKGVIDAPRGTVALGAGQEVILNQSNGQKIGTFPSPIKHENEDTGIDNSGMIVASRTELKADGNSYAIAIRHSGFINVLGTEEQKGAAYLVAEKGNNIISGAISAENADGTGGDIQILGECLFLFENSNIDASGDKGGGNILVGGDRGGNNPAVINAKMTFIDENTSIFADAIEEGDGGKIVIWSDEVTYFYGAVSARGGENSGNGGDIEITGKKNLDFQGEVDRLAPKGKEGIFRLNSSVAYRGILTGY